MRSSALGFGLCLLLLAGAVRAQSPSADPQPSFGGIASWYGPGFAGKLTSSGEIYDPSRLTAAHRSLAFGTYVLVRNLDTGASVVVRINDRGPFARDRIIDLSEAAAQLIGMIPTGTARVSCSVVPPEEALNWKGSGPAGSAPGSAAGKAAGKAAGPAAGPARGAAAPSAAALRHVRIQVASYGSADNAEATRLRLRNSGLEALIERAQGHYRVVFPDLGPDEARRIQALLESLGYRSLLISSWQ